jgi:RIO kinase 1
MHEPLATLLADGVIDEICGRLKSGKEADLWLVRHGGEIVAAKVYKARQVRSFRNNAGYKEGRQVRDTRTQRAMDRGSRFGQAAAEDAWKAKEADALYALHAAGVRVPKPVLFYDGVLLMELVLDPHGHPAPRLVEADVAPEVASALYADLRGQVVRMLGCDLIHGDLSPYNVLLGPDGPVVIDFPQVVGAAHNSQAETFFQRDLENVRRFFEAIDPALRAASNDAREIWRAYVRRELTPDFVPTGKAPPPPAKERGGGHGDRQRPRPHERAAPPREHTRPERPRHAGRTPPREAAAESRPDAHGRQHAAPRAEPQRRPHSASRPSHGPQHTASRPGSHVPQHSAPRAEPHERPHSAPRSEPRVPRHSAPPERHPQQSSAPRREAHGSSRPDSRPEQQGRPHSAGPGRGQPPSSRAPDRRRAAPAPEVIRVTRPPLAPPRTPPAGPHRSPPALSPTPGAQRPDDARPHRRRRRRP